MMCRRCNGRMKPGEKGFACEDCGAIVPYNSKTHHETRKASGEGAKDGEAVFRARD